MVMDAGRFDGLVRSFGRVRSRRQTLRGLAGGLVAGVFALGEREADAAKRIGGTPCTKGKQCKTGKCVGTSGAKTCSCTSKFPTCAVDSVCWSATCNVETKRCEAAPDPTKDGDSCANGHCQNGTCICDAGFQICGTSTTCQTNVRTDPNNCGDCGTECDRGLSCCGGSCIDLNSRTNCGACGHRCGANEDCVNQVCSPRCDDAAGVICPSTCGECNFPPVEGGSAHCAAGDPECADLTRACAATSDCGTGEQCQPTKCGPEQMVVNH